MPLAEKALATMHETMTVKSKPVWRMILSHSATLATPAPLDPILSQYLHTDPTFFTKVKAQEIFQLFRQAGPLVSVRLNVDIGNNVKTAIVQYWYEDHANTARIKYTTMHKKKKQRPPFSLRTFDPCGLHCSVSCIHVSHRAFPDKYLSFFQGVQSFGHSQSSGGCLFPSTWPL
ncbi:hypothetical protein BC629DRAFT_343333 [Irpex lacteus]|nr:hypothetical protein BC629DRAFT_343333 [Irpex lacteus]